jgi:hypothetical protein
MPRSRVRTGDLGQQRLYGASTSMPVVPVLVATNRSAIGFLEFGTRDRVCAGPG